MMELAATQMAMLNVFHKHLVKSSQGGCVVGITIFHRGGVHRV